MDCKSSKIKEAELCSAQTSDGFECMKTKHPDMETTLKDVSLQNGYKLLQLGQSCL